MVFAPDNATAFAAAEGVRSEYVLRVTGAVRKRPAGTENPHLPSGMIEIAADKIEVLNKSEPLPFQLDEADLGETVRLKYRYLDLRREHMRRNILLRHKLVRTLRHYLEDQEFVEIETPMLTKSTPEGARDYLVPSRTHPGHFFALPQSPQLFKQLLMVAGFERYYQVTRCFRDEDLRADRQPEFTQLDIETSFLDEEGVMAHHGGHAAHRLQDGAERGSAQAVPAPGVRRGHAPLWQRQARPAHPARTGRGRRPAEGGRVQGVLPAPPTHRPGGSRRCACRTAARCRARRSTITPPMSRCTAPRAWPISRSTTPPKGRDGLQSPILKFLPDEAIAEIMRRTGAQTGDLIFFGADSAKVVNDALGALRIKLGHDCKLLQGEWQPLWVVDFPMFDYDAAAKRFVALHHPFTAPKAQDAETIDLDPANALSRAYDMVLNGSEIGGGSIRIHSGHLQQKVFSLLGIDEAAQREKFGFLLDALKFGAPPHGGIAFGIDRISALMAGAESIRDVIAFPKTQKASCLLTDAPSVVDEAQLRELHIKLRKPVEPVADKN